MPDLPPDLALRRVQADAFVDLARIHRTIERRLAAMFEEAGLTDVTPAQATVLQVLVTAREPLTAREVARRLSLSEVTVGRFVRSLDQHGWLERRRDPDDSRAIHLLPTQRTYDELPRFLRVSNTLLDDAFAGFDRRAIEQLGRDVDQVRANLDSDGGPIS